MTRRIVFAVCLVACGGGAEPAATPDTDTASADGASEPRGKACLADARAPRVPSPDAPGKIEVSHILVRHAELKEPRGATRSPEQACLRALDALQALQSGADWDETMAKFSDSKSSSLGRVALEDLSPGFAEAAFALDVDTVSYVVESDRGFHIILRER